MPVPNTDGTPSIATPLYDANATRRPLPTVTTNTTNREAPTHPGGQAPPANTGGTPSITTAPGDPNASSKKPPGSSSTTSINRDPAVVAYRSSQVSAANADGTPSTAPPNPDVTSSLRRHNSLATGTMDRDRGAQPYRPDDQGQGDSGSRKSSKYRDHGGQRVHGGEGERKRPNVLTKPSKEASSRRERRESTSSNDSIDITMVAHGAHSYSSTEKERRSDHTTGASKATAVPSNVQPQSRHGSQYTSYSQAVKEKSQYRESGSNAPVSRASDSANSRQPQIGPKPQLPLGAADAHPPTARRPREAQHGENEPTDGRPTHPSHDVDDSGDDLSQTDDEETGRPHPHFPGGLPIEGAQRVHGEGPIEAHIAQPSGYLAGFKNIAGAILGPGTGPGQPPRDRTKEELQRTKAKLQQLEYEFRRARGDNANLHRTCFELDSETRRQKDTIRSLQHELSNMERELQEYKNLSEIRGRELIGAQVFLTKADLLSISDVKDKVNALNDENFQASASLGDSLIHLKYELGTEEKEAAFAEVCRTVSEPLARALVMESQKPEPEVNPLVVQVVLEMYLVHFCSSKIESWFPGVRETSDFLTTVYGEIRRTEEQAVSGRWRALTRAQIRPNSTTWRGEFMMGLGNIFKIADWTIGSQENLDAFEQKLPAIFKAIEDLRLALGEKVTSIDLEVSVASPGVPFNHGWMEDGYGDSRQGNTKKSGESVAGTTGIGLKKMLPSPSGEQRFENVLSPKVVLVSTLQEALRPPSPAPPRSNKRGRARGEGEPEGKGRSSPSQGLVDV